MDAQLALIVERIAELCEAGWKHIRIVTDHGWLLMPGGLPKSELPRHQTETRWGRCAVLKDSAHGTPLTFGRSEEHTSELQSLMRISYAVFCLKKKKTKT